MIAGLVPLGLCGNADISADEFAETVVITRIGTEILVGAFHLLDGCEKGGDYFSHGAVVRFGG